ncbi:MAG: bifunctional aconitate hydratase 2/2-methylisocitrate dehydratase [Thermodesulfobacteriota bacterium]|nr:bifunctional aconitate hydratase 2/2-methylisocitrate dehydratase [Thermodesulfobacteriota bacterium]
MIDAYLENAAERGKNNIPPEALTPSQTETLCRLLEYPPAGRQSLLTELLADRVPPGVDEAARVKADFLGAVARGEKTSPLITPAGAVKLLGTMLGGYNIQQLTAFLEMSDLASLAATELANAIFAFDGYEAVARKAAENEYAARVMDAWKDAAWFLRRPAVPEKIELTVFRVDGEITTDDLSPAGEAGTRSDIPLHALSMLKYRMDDPIDEIQRLKAHGRPLAFVGDVVGTGSSRKSAANSLIWHIGEDIAHVPNKRRGGVVLGGKIAPIFFNTLEDAGALPVECDVSKIANGDTIAVYPYEGRIENIASRETVAAFSLKSPVILDEVRAGGRIALIAGRTLTNNVREKMGLGPSDVFRAPIQPEKGKGGFTLAQKIVGRACGRDGVVPGEYCEPALATVGSQDTTGSMTRDELKELACLEFSADLVMQSFCHTAAYPTDRDRAMHDNLTRFFQERGGVALQPGDGVIHSWINRMLLPNTVGTGGDSHTRFPVGISFPAGSGLVAFGAAIGKMPLDMPESVLVRFSGTRRPGITLRDMVNMIPYAAIDAGLLTVAKENKQNVFSGRILEIEGVSDLTVPQGFELTNASAERSSAAGTIKLDIPQVTAWMRENAAILESLIEKGYQDHSTLRRRIDRIHQWLDAPWLIEADPDAEYAAVLDIDLSTYEEPILACPNDPDDVRLLSAVAGQAVDEVFIGSCMTNADHFRRAAAILAEAQVLQSRLWVTPPTIVDRTALAGEGHIDVFERLGARVDIPGCSLCMGNQARVAPDTVVMSTSTRNFPNRMGDNTLVYLGSAELAAVTAILGRIPTITEYQGMIGPGVK